MTPTQVEIPSWTAAEVARRRPARRETYLTYARDGFAFLRDHMWDREQGGFYWMVGEGGGPSTTIVTHGGDLVVMGGRCQKDYQHSVPKQRQPAGARLSLNFSIDPPAA